MTDGNLEALEEAEFVRDLLVPYGRRGQPAMVQIGANDGVNEYAKVGGRDFVHGFLQQNPQWRALLVEPIPEVFAQLRESYAGFRNQLSFLNCAITERVEDRMLTLHGKDGKASSLLHQKSGERISVPCLPYPLACRLAGLHRVDFLKIDAEGYDEIILDGLLRQAEPGDLPAFILWEQLEAETRSITPRLRALGYEVFLTGRSRTDVWMDRVAIYPGRLMS
ncbi:FkbM family methyltransferase [uncultured Maritimibacter sp.]|uniref:FkbM family methyltransferase n=1 Tax=uncultured Maritimibacter sp. TaxID=991866 RepID=UPI002638AD09|nr:FkbM family methyltransferase [uncultured Maritimibacter sp.]